MKKLYPSQRQLLREFAIKPKKSLGQNFIVKEEVLDAIVELCELDDTDYVVEIGAGLGGLTCRLRDRARGVFAIEKDRRLAHILEDKIIKSKRVKVVQADALMFDFERAASAAGARLTVVGNLPYNVGSRLTLELLRKHGLIKKMVLMYQREVADRITALPGKKDYGLLTVVSNLHADVQPVLTIGREAFYPKPKVDSRMLRFTLLDHPRCYLENENYFLNVVKAAFSQRRKKLKNALKVIKGMPVPVDSIAATFEEEDLDPQRRGETLSVEEFCRLANSLYRRGHGKDEVVSR